MAEEVVRKPVLRRGRTVQKLLTAHTFSEEAITPYAGVPILRDPINKPAVAQPQSLAQSRGRGAQFPQSNSSRSEANTDPRYDLWFLTDATIGRPNEVLTGSVVDELSRWVSKRPDSTTNPMTVGSLQPRAEQSYRLFLPSQTGEAARLLGDFYSACRGDRQRVVVRMIMRTVDELLRRGAFGVCDEILRTADLSQLSVEAMLATLTITLPAGQELKHRASFRARVASALGLRGRADVSALLRGL